MRQRDLLLLPVALVAGCTLYTGGGGQCEAPAEMLRDPSSGACVTFGPCSGIDPIEGPACVGPCENLGEGACLATPTCHATYTGADFDACWDTQPLDPQAGGCATLDALGCASRDDCASQMGPDFLGCADEPVSGTCDATDCAPTTRCIVRCDATGCNATCIPDGPSTPGTCDGVVQCTVDAPACPTGTAAGIANGCFTGYCIPTADCGSPSPGACTGIACGQVGPACPLGTTPGVKNGCFDGYCIPVDACP